MSAFITATVKCDGWEDWRDKIISVHMPCEQEATSNAVYEMLDRSMGFQSRLVMQPKEYASGWDVKLGKIQCPECFKKEQESK